MQDYADVGVIYYVVYNPEYYTRPKRSPLSGLKELSNGRQKLSSSLFRNGY